MEPDWAGIQSGKWIGMPKTKGIVYENPNHHLRVSILDHMHEPERTPHKGLPFKQIRCRTISPVWTSWCLGTPHWSATRRGPSGRQPAAGAVRSSHMRRSRSRTFAVTTSLRMTAVTATLWGFPFP